MGLKSALELEALRLDTLGEGEQLLVALALPLHIQDGELVHGPLECLLVGVSGILPSCQTRNLGASFERDLTSGIVDQLLALVVVLRAVAVALVAWAKVQPQQLVEVLLRALTLAMLARDLLGDLVELRLKSFKVELQRRFDRLGAQSLFRIIWTLKEPSPKEIRHAALSGSEHADLLLKACHALFNFASSSALRRCLRRRFHSFGGG